MSNEPQPGVDSEPQSVQEIVGNQPFVSIDVDGARVDMLGTAHISAISRDTVRDLLTQQTYDAVAVELCARRHATLSGVNHFAEMDIWKVIREKKMFSVMASLLLSAYQRRLAEQLDIEPGAEFREAIVHADQQNIDTVLIDREIGISLNRFYGQLKWWQKPVLFSSFLASLIAPEKISEEDIEDLKRTGTPAQNKDSTRQETDAQPPNDDLFDAFGQLWPSAKELVGVIIGERNEYMVAKIREYLREHKAQRLLVIIGAGHLSGMARDLAGNRSAQDDAKTIASYEQIPPRASWLRFFPWLITGLIVLGFVIGFSRDISLGVDLFIAWVLFNGSLSALGALLVLAHPLAIATAFVAAPITSLNPLIGAGVVTAAVQFIMRKPLVSDFENVKADMSSFAGWRSNRFLHLFLVFFFSSLGSLIGTYLGGFYIYDTLNS